MSDEKKLASEVSLPSVTPRGDGAATNCDGIRALSLWTNGTDYVIARSAAEALAHAMYEADLTEDDLGTVDTWRAEPEDRVWTIRDEDGNVEENATTCHLLAQHAAKGAPVPLYFWSDEW